MGEPTTLLSRRMTELLKGAQDVAAAKEKRRCSEAEFEKRNTEIFLALVGAYTSVEQLIREHSGPFDKLLRSGLSQNFIKINIDVSTARKIIDQMIYEFELNKNRQAS